MKTTSTFLMMTAAAFIGGTAATAQTTPVMPAQGTEQSALEALALLINASNGAPSEADIRTALDGYTVNRIRIDDDGEVRIRAVTPEGETIRIRVEDGELRYRVGLFGDTSDLNDDNSASTSDANGGDTSGTSDSNGGDTSGTSDSNDDNGGNTSGSNDDNGGSTGGGSDDD